MKKILTINQHTMERELLSGVDENSEITFLVDSIAFEVEFSDDGITVSKYIVPRLDHMSLKMETVSKGVINIS